MARYTKLIMVTEANNNKFYEMKDNEDGTFTAIWGRVGGGSESKIYNYREWDKKYKEKIRKGYEDITELCTVPDKKSNIFKDILDNKVQSFVRTIQSYSKEAVKENYIVTTATQLQFDSAQEIMIKLNDMDYNDSNSINDLLLSLFKIIPRKMKKVNDFLYNKISKEKLTEIYIREQSLLDILSTQIKTDVIEENADSNTTLIEALGLTINHIDDIMIIKEVKGLLGEISHRFSDLYEVKNVKTENRYKRYFETVNNKNEKLFWHGSRNENWWSIIQTGLLLRPNAVITGKMWGEGHYFAPSAKKSEGYTSLSGSYWARGSSKKGYMALYNVHMGNQYDVYSHFSGAGYLNYNKLRNLGNYDSLYAHKAHNFLYNDEAVIYQEQQNTIKYLVELT